MVRFGQFVVGPPACGKTTYCNGISQFMRQMGRPVAIVNLDFANEITKDKEGSYDCAVDVRALVSLERVMEEYALGPNGGLVYCMEYLLENVDWLVQQLDALEDKYIIFDCPGQVELYTHHSAVQDIVQALQKRMDFRLCSVHLLDSFYCCEPTTFISAVLSVTSTMLRLGLPHVNVLSKVDLLPLYGPLPFSLDFFTEMHDLAPLLRYVDAGRIADEKELQHSDEQGSDGCDDDEDDDMGEGKEEDIGVSVPVRKPPRSRLVKMMEGLCSVLSDFGLVGFLPMNVQDAPTVGRILIAVDKANGYTFAADQALQQRQRSGAGAGAGQGLQQDADPERAQQESLSRLFQVASQDLETTYERSLEIFEKYTAAWEREREGEGEGEGRQQDAGVHRGVAPIQMGTGTGTGKR